MGEVFQPPEHFCGPPPDPLQQVPVFPVLRAPELDAGLQVGYHQSRAVGQNQQDTAGLLGCEHTLLGRVELLINQQPQVLLLTSAPNSFSTQPIFILFLALFPSWLVQQALSSAFLSFFKTLFKLLIYFLCQN